MGYGVVVHHAAVCHNHTSSYIAAQMRRIVNNDSNARVATLGLQLLQIAIGNRLIGSLIGRQ